jgi:hypothetical protein
MSENNIKVSS